MEIKVKSKSWWGLGSSGCRENEEVFPIKLKEKRIIMERTFWFNKKKGFIFKRVVEVESNELIFAYKVLEATNDCVKIKIYGSVVENKPGYLMRSEKDNKPCYVLKPGEVLKFTTPTMDAGDSFELTLV